MSNIRDQKIESYGNAYQLLADALRQFPRDMWDFKASADDWSIHEIVVHIADSETQGYIRCRRLVAEPGTSVMAYDEAEWARALHYDRQSADDALELFRWLRRHTYNLIRSLPDSTWANSVHHPERGTMTLDDWLDIYEKHVPLHVAQMKRAHVAWTAWQG